MNLARCFIYQRFRAFTEHSSADFKDQTKPGKLSCFNKLYKGKVQQQKLLCRINCMQGITSQKL